MSFFGANEEEKYVKKIQYNELTSNCVQRCVVFQIPFTVTSIGAGATCTAIAIDFQATAVRYPSIYIENYFKSNNSRLFDASEMNA